MHTGIDLLDALLCYILFLFNNFEVGIAFTLRNFSESLNSYKALIGINIKIKRYLLFIRSTCNENK